MERLDRQMRFVTEIDKLKGVLRQTMLAGPGRRENSAEHSWHLAVMAVTLAEHAPPGTDIGRVTAMVLLHDLVEIDAGDLFAYADDAQQARQERAERAAADRIFALLPAGQGDELRPRAQRVAHGTIDAGDLGLVGDLGRGRPDEPEQRGADDAAGTDNFHQPRKNNCCKFGVPFSSIARLSRHR